MADVEISMRFQVFGRVQGVGFRDSVHRVALRIGGLRGHVRNLRDGSVEVCVTGDPGRIDELRSFIAHGPPLARVDGVDAAPYDPPFPPGPFTVVFR